MESIFFYDKALFFMEDKEKCFFVVGKGHIKQVTRTYKMLIYEYREVCYTGYRITTDYHIDGSIERRMGKEVTCGRRQAD